MKLEENSSALNKYDAILLITEKNLPVLKTSMPYIRKNLGAQSIYAVASKRIKDDVEALGIDFLDEDNLIEGLTFSRIKELIAVRGLDTSRTGWYYQQFLKYGFAYKSNFEYYLTWDADTIPLNEIRYFHNELPSFVEKKELHWGYFDTIDRLFNGEIRRYDPAISFVAENMMFNANVVKEIIAVIESNKKIQGQNFYEKIINTVKPEYFQSGFSEFETYGNYVKIKYPGMYGSLRLRTLRNGSFFVGREPSVDQIEWAKRDFDIMSIEGRELFIAKVTRHKWFRKIVHLKTISKVILKARSIRRTILGLEKLDYD